MGTQTGVFFRCGVAALALAVAAGAWLAGPGQARAAACPASGVMPSVSLTALPGDIVYDNGKSRAELQRMQGRQGAAGLNRGWHAIGLTRTELQFQMKIRVSTLPRGDRAHCASLAAVDASLGYDRITIYIDRRYANGSCQYQSVLDHENLHLAVFRDTLALYAPEVERRLNDAAGRLQPVSARTPEQAAAKLQKALQREMEPLFNDMNRHMDAENGRLDSADSYRREQARCSTW